MSELDERLASIDNETAELVEAVNNERADRQEAIRLESSNRRRGFWATAVLALALFAVVARNEWVRVDAENQRIAQRDRSRCDIRAGFVDLANATDASEELVVDAIHNYDARLAALDAEPCGGVAVCGDGWLSQSVGRSGACSGHGGVRRILVEGN